MHGVDVANPAFTALTLLANAAFVLVVVALLAAGLTRTGIGGRSARALGALAPRAVPLAAVIAVVTTAGSLYYSEVVGWLPCELCWYQRITMYPLSAILVVGLIRRDRGVHWTALPFVVVGIPLSLYHWLVERVPSLAEGSSCSAFVPCSIPYFQELGYVTLAFMDLSAFLLIGALLVVSRSRLDSPNPPSPDSPTPHPPGPDPVENPT